MSSIEYVIITFLLFINLEKEMNLFSLIENPSNSLSLLKGNESRILFNSTVSICFNINELNFPKNFHFYYCTALQYLDQTRSSFLQYSPFVRGLFVVLRRHYCY